LPRRERTLCQENLLRGERAGFGGESAQGDTLLASQNPQKMLGLVRKLLSTVSDLSKKQKREEKEERHKASADKKNKNDDKEGEAGGKGCPGGERKPEFERWNGSQAHAPETAQKRGGGGKREKAKTSRRLDPRPLQEVSMAIALNKRKERYAGPPSMNNLSAKESGKR